MVAAFLPLVTGEGKENQVVGITTYLTEAINMGEEMEFLSRTAFAKINKVSSETVRLWMNQGRFKTYDLHTSGGVEKIILKGTIVEAIPKGWLTIYDWAKKSGIDITKVMNALYTKKLPFAKKFFKKVIVPVGAKYPTIERGRKVRGLTPGYISIKTWCRVNQFTLTVMLRKNFMTPNTKWVYRYEYFYVPSKWDGISGFHKN
jgi:hypothetical protein